MTEGIKQEIMSCDVLWLIKDIPINQVIGFIFNGIAYITHPLFTNGCSIAYAKTDYFIGCEDYEIVKEDSEILINTAYIHEEVYKRNLKETRE